MALLDKLLGFLAPHECLGCGYEGSLLCYECLEQLPPAPKDTSAFTLYEGLAKELVWKLKSSGAQAAAAVMADCMRQLIPADPGIYLVPLPTATSRVRQRGYDQAALLTRELSKATGAPVLKCLVRTGQAHQVGSSRKQRLSQLQSALYIKRPGRVKGCHLLLIDDVTTTGASFAVAKEVLLAAGAARVDTLAFAYTPAPK